MLREGKLWLAFWSAREEKEERPLRDEERESEVRFPGQPTEKIEAKVNPLPPPKKDPPSGSAFSSSSPLQSLPVSERSLYLNLWLMAFITQICRKKEGKEGERRKGR